MIRTWFLPLILLLAMPAFAQTQEDKDPLSRMKSYPGRQTRTDGYKTATDRVPTYRTASERWASYRTATDKYAKPYSTGAQDKNAIGTDLARLAGIDINDRMASLDQPYNRLSPTQGAGAQKVERDLAQQCVYQPRRCQKPQRLGSGRQIYTSWQRNRRRVN
ncbi:hypothetical protein PQ455_18290 [Sphingomonas naphthae]|uniref:Uncharacterized protein n=1 Tax=Sphingomonas naphthae TaxID=1813468 RepID=A0ABY7TJX7_9SPHN|nr:hypothetical protein [Sphingomonas naphthae]WCT73531.1 hypothetical protein PQ455_18290 [Sphingomonas naphthae]